MTTHPTEARYKTHPTDSVVQRQGNTIPLKHLNRLQSPYEVYEPLPAVGEVAAADEGAPGWAGIARLPVAWHNITFLCYLGCKI